MSSERAIPERAHAPTVAVVSAVALALALTSGCAGFRRGDAWDESAGSSGGAEDDAPPEVDTSAGTTEGPTPGGTETGTTGSAPAGPSFDADVLPLLRAGCERCHAADGAASHTQFLLDVDDATAYDASLMFVDLEAPRSSPLLSKGAGQGHTGGVIYDDHSAAYDTILAWIEGGALP